jgi:hypothetical protein
MRRLPVLILSIATLSFSVLAQEVEEPDTDDVEQTDTEAAADTDEPQPVVDDEFYQDVDDEDFRPTEEIPADQSIPFPSDI